MSIRQLPPCARFDQDLTLGIGTQVMISPALRASAKRRVSLWESAKWSAWHAVTALPQASTSLGSSQASGLPGLVWHRARCSMTVLYGDHDGAGFAASKPYLPRV